MSRGNKWVPLDKYLAQYFVKIKRPFSEIEAMFSYTLDIDNGKSGSIAGYSLQWQWSRNKVRRFLKGIRTVEGHLMDSKKTQKGQAIHFIDNALMTKKDSKRTVKGQQKDSKRYTTIEPKPKPNKKEISDSTESAPLKLDFYKTKTGKKLIGKRLSSFNNFWETFNFKQGKATAADSWYNIQTLTNQILEQILIAAKIESDRRPELISKGSTPKWAQGWLSDRRWEDEIYQGQKQTPEDILKKHGIGVEQ